MRLLFTLALFFGVLSTSEAQKKSGRLLGECEDCHLLFDGMPALVTSTTNIAPPPEPGERLTITGIILKPDGKTPAPDIVLYFYHTDHQGNYSPANNQRVAIRHGHLRGWVKSDSNGRYTISTIRPGSYPNSRNPSHIHPIILEPDGTYYWVDEFLFEDDPFLTPAIRKEQTGRGGKGIVTLTRDNEGSWLGTRNITLRLNVR